MKTKRSIPTKKVDRAEMTSIELGQTAVMRKNVRKLSVGDLWYIQNHRRNYLPHQEITL